MHRLRRLRRVERGSNTFAEIRLGQDTSTNVSECIRFVKGGFDFVLVFSSLLYRT